MMTYTSHEGRRAHEGDNLTMHHERKDALMACTVEDRPQERQPHLSRHCIQQDIRTVNQINIERLGKGAMKSKHKQLTPFHEEKRKNIKRGEKKVGFSWLRREASLGCRQFL